MSSRLCLVWLLTCFSSLAFVSSQAYADQITLKDIDQTETLFWDELYGEGSWTLYCGEKFSNKRGLMLEAIYSMEWVAKHLGCDSVASCRDKKPRFNSIEADLHNYYPVLLMTGRARNDYSFGEIPGEFREYYECDYETDGQDRLVEPRRSARGNIARALLYMHVEYKLPLSEKQLKWSKRWHNEDPASADEKRRNTVIENRQKTRNTFVDQPDSVNKLIP